MNFTVAALLGLTLAQPSGPDYTPWKSKNITIPIAYTPEQKAGIGHVELYASADRGQTWPLVAKVLPNQDKFVYTPPKDGLYWFHMVIVDRQGRRDPANLTAEPPPLKMLVDTTPPVVTITNIRRNGPQVTVEWRIEDDYVNEMATQVSFRTLPVAGMPDVWKRVLLDKLPPGARNGVKFPAETTEPIQVRVVGVDLVGNYTVATRDVPGADGSTAVTPAVANNPPPPLQTGPSPGPESVTPVSGPEPGFPSNPAPPPPGSFPGPNPLPVTPPAPLITPPPPSAPYPGSPQQAAYPAAQPQPVASPPQYPAGATAPVSPVQPANTPDPAQTGVAHAPLIVASSPPANQAPQTLAAAGAPDVDSFDPRQPLTPVATGAQSTPTNTYPTSQPVPEPTRAQHVRSFRFDLNYAINLRGPSGIKRIDLWVTRDDGQNWVQCSQHPGTDGVVKVDLQASLRNPPEGAYGFRLVPWSGAGLCDAAPVAGDAPDIRVVVDTSAPVVQILNPTSDPSDPAALLLRWQATDTNLADDPITLEWSDKPTGPWQSVAAPGGEGLVQVRAPAPGTAVRLPNTGSYSWRVPPGVPPHVHLRITARDAAGNVTERVSLNPLMVDLTKPRVKITGVGVGNVRP